MDAMKIAAWVFLGFVWGGLIGGFIGHKYTVRVLERAIEQKYGKGE